MCAASLEDYCKEKYKGPIPGHNLALEQMLEGLAFIHSRNYVHRDVKPQNILISFSGEIKIADFGVCKSVTDGSGKFSMSGLVGTCGWLAPELTVSSEEPRMANQEEDPIENPTGRPRATYAIDVFALGCVFYYFLTKENTRLEMNMIETET